MEITATQLEMLIDRLHDMSSPMMEFDVRNDYSGRGMYDKACLGFVTDRPLHLHGAICAILAEDETGHPDMADFDGLYWYDLSPNTDNMGLSSIVYYSNLSVVE